MDNQNVIIAAIVGLVLIEILTLHYKREPIEEALRLQTVEVLEAEGLKVETIEFEGRDATLRGEVESEEDKKRAARLVDEVWDVRMVTNLLKVKSAEEAPVLQAESEPVLRGFHLKSNVDGKLQLSGMVSDESTRNMIVAAVLDAFPGRTIDNQIQISAGESQNWLPALLRSITAISVVKNPTLEIPEGGQALHLQGELAAEIQKVNVLKDLMAALNRELELKENLDVVVEKRDPALVAMEKRIQDLQTTTRIQFKINTADLAELSKQVLDQVAEILKEAPGVQIEVQGHTDNLGNARYNMELSQKRADSVRNYLVTRGIDATRLTAVGYGPTRPVATNTTKQGRITNRRVVFSLKGGS